MLENLLVSSLYDFLVKTVLFFDASNKTIEASNKNYRIAGKFGEFGGSSAICPTKSSNYN